jgi:hypothetical protein
MKVRRMEGAPLLRLFCSLELDWLTDAHLLLEGFPCLGKRLSDGTSKLLVRLFKIQVKPRHGLWKVCTSAQTLQKAHATHWYSTKLRKWKLRGQGCRR